MFIRIGQRPDHGFDEPLGLLSDCHRRVEHFLTVLNVIANDGDGGPLDGARSRQLDDALTYFDTAAPRHTADEEQSLFPRIEASDSQAAAHARELIQRLAADHAVANLHHLRIDQLGRRWLAEKALGAEELAELRERLAWLTDMYRAHIDVEDHKLFPAAGRILSGADLLAIGREMAERRA